MRKSSILAFVLLLLVLDLMVFDRIMILGMKPDATVIVIVYVALRFGCVVGMFLGFLIGVAQVSIMTTASAALPLASTIVGYLAGRFGTKVAFESTIVQAVIIIISVLILDAINFIWLEPEHFLFDLARFSVGSAIYTSIVGVGVASLVSRFLGQGRLV